ncbi:uncharacterized protein Nmag_3424 [Natrialba magadii ATCC 43099]|uniref:Polysaccharide deacetylase n=1 Tax=Natrialba magadii (strain ATCC 43099 / DSM 3394 / CCM 3739 / CIP 104546 / IAM 13178 / JCM 8861 / NBRC 102185 / NCIMB 2190 / MS3) TaxID=547559 RepID=D3STA7_NATMM|nr:polysaccharide deacetylase family protein [Natrialba magadii]ADD06974.1 uncharacterized protein Nmag_3424 [Natrialba magadii ATCC 43099]ELY28883.1 hypothetical protein C500_13095 [Natrialba magadii ATCC 43099]
MNADHTSAQPARITALPDDAEFALCLTHDVDRPYKGFRSLYYATQERPGYHLRTALDRSNPYWQFAEIMELEDDLGVRSAFYFLNEQHLFRDRPPREWLSPANWVQHLGRYEIDSDDIAATIRDLSTGGWEVGLHGSYHTQHDRDRLRTEKVALENVLGEQLSGGRQHHLRLSVPETWEHYREIGLSYDTSLGSTTDCGFHDGYHPIRPFGDEFVVFPLTIMDQALPDPATNPDAARRTCERLLVDAARNDAVMTVLWHPRYFNEREFPGHRALYQWLVERALELGAWVGSPGELYETIDAETVDQHPVSIGTDSEADPVSIPTQPDQEQSRRDRGDRREEATPQLRSASTSGGESQL